MDFLIGKPIPRIDLLDKVTGKEKKLDDMNFPRMLFGKVLRSPLAHAKLLHIDMQKAKRVKGVKAIITAEHIPLKMFSIIPENADKFILAKGKVRFVGDEIAAIAAIDEDAAEEALDLMRVEFEELPAVFTPEDSMKDGAPRIHDEIEKNLSLHQLREFGDLEGAFERSEHIFEDRFETGAVAHCNLEPYGCIALFKEDDRLTLWSTTQAPFMVRKQISELFNFREEKVRVINSPSCGGFGGRIGMSNLEPIGAILSRFTGKPVKIVNSRREEFENTRTRYPMIVELKTGVSADGRLLARRGKIIIDNGAYNSHGALVGANAGAKVLQLYRVPAVGYELFVVYTNKLFGGAFRGYGDPQIIFAIESQMDDIAEKLGIDPLEIRLKNANQPGEVTPSGSRITSCGLRECLNAVAKQLNWNSPTAKGGLKHRGMGIACGMHTGGGSKRFYGGVNISGIIIEMDPHGKANVFSGAAEIGQGVETILAQIVAQVIGTDIERINVICGDTEKAPLCVGALGSRLTFVAGNAAKRAAEEIRQTLWGLAAKLLEANIEDLECASEKIYVKKHDDRQISLAELVKECYRKGISLRREVVYDDFYSDIGDKTTGYGNPNPTYSFCAQGAEVDVDIETGNIKLVRFVAAHDVGKAINPLALEGQIEGGVSQGMGFALTEEILWEQGKILNPNLTDYKILTSLDMPIIESIIIESNDPQGPFGAKGIGELTIIPTAPAIANAVYDAVGLRVRSLPMSGEKILRALAKKRIRG